MRPGAASALWTLRQKLRICESTSMTPILCTGNVSTVALQRSFHKDTLKISSLSKWVSSESRYEPPCAKLASCSFERHYTVLLTNSCPAATRFLRTPIKADTKSIGRVFVERTLERHCRNLNEHKSSKESYLYFLQIQGSGYRVHRAEAAPGLTHVEASRWQGATSICET